MTEPATIREDLRRFADRMRVQLHLAGMDARAEWDRQKPHTKTVFSWPLRIVGSVRAMARAFIDRVQAHRTRALHH